MHSDVTTCSTMASRKQPPNTWRRWLWVRDRHGALGRVASGSVFSRHILPGCRNTTYERHLGRLTVLSGPAPIVSEVGSEEDVGKALRVHTWYDTPRVKSWKTSGKETTTRPAALHVLRCDPTILGCCWNYLLRPNLSPFDLHHTLSASAAADSRLGIGIGRVSSFSFGTQH